MSHYLILSKNHFRLFFFSEIFSYWQNCSFIKFLSLMSYSYNLFFLDWSAKRHRYQNRKTSQEM